MQVPGLIDGVAGRDLDTGRSGASEVAETFVFKDDARGVFQRPAIFAREAIGKGERGVRRADRVRLKKLPQVGVKGVHSNIDTSGRVSRSSRRVARYETGQPTRTKPTHDTATRISVSGWVSPSVTLK